MTKEPIIVLLGHSVLIDGVAIGLERQRNLHLYRLILEWILKVDCAPLSPNWLFLSWMIPVHPAC